MHTYYIYKIYIDHIHTLIPPFSLNFLYSFSFLIFFIINDPGGQLELPICT